MFASAHEVICPLLCRTVWSRQYRNLWSLQRSSFWPGCGACACHCATTGVDVGSGDASTSIHRGSLWTFPVATETGTHRCSSLQFLAVLRGHPCGEGSQGDESSKTPSSSPRFSGPGCSPNFCDSPSLVNTGKKVEDDDAQAWRQLELCLRVHAKIASGVYCLVLRVL